MSPKTVAIIVFVLYALLSYATMFVRPRKCSEHETPDERYRVAVRAPFLAIVALAMSVGLYWAVVETFFQP